MIKKKQWIRISELEKITGIPRRTIHFYLQKGLLPEPIKTGKTMSYYNETHIKILEIIQNAKNDGIPLLAIREKISQIEIESNSQNETINTLLLNEKQNKSEKQKIPKKFQGKKTRESIIETGCALFREKGYKDTKINDITKRLNIGKGSFYFNFSDKKELLFECVPIIFKELFSEGWEKIRKEQNPIKRFELRAQAVIPVINEFCSILQLCKEALEDSDPKLKNLGKKTYLSIRDPLENDIKKGIKSGMIKQMDPVIVSTFMIGIIESINFLQKIDKRLPATAWESISNIIANAIKN